MGKLMKDMGVSDKASKKEDKRPEADMDTLSDMEDENMSDAQEADDEDDEDAQDADGLSSRYQRALANSGDQSTKEEDQSFVRYLRNSQG